MLDFIRLIEIGTDIDMRCKCKIENCEEGYKKEPPGPKNESW